MNLKETRKNIDKIDSELLKLVSKRMELALRAKKLRNGSNGNGNAESAGNGTAGNGTTVTSDEEREKEIITNARKQSIGLVAPEFSEKLFRELIGEAKRVQEKGLKLVGFQGEHGAYGEIATKSVNPEWVPVPCTEFSDVFEGVKNGQLDLGIVPVENSLEGAVTQVNDLLVDTELNVIGEIMIPVHHCLLALPETDYREIKVVYSHPQALAQCREFLTRNKLEPRQFYDTAGAAKMLSNERPKAAAAIASKLAAEIYGLDVIKENVEDHPSNVTRFLVLSRDVGSGTGKSEDGNKCSVIFETSHKAGSLFRVLKVFADASINLTRIESRPLRNDPGKYVFLLDFQGSDREEAAQRVLDNVKKETMTFKFLGCYKEAKI